MSKPRCPAGSAGIECSDPFLCCRSVRGAGRGDGMGQGDGHAPPGAIRRGSCEAASQPMGHVRRLRPDHASGFGHTFPQACREGGSCLVYPSGRSRLLRVFLNLLSQPTGSCTPASMPKVPGRTRTPRAPSPQRHMGHVPMSIPVGTPRLLQRLNRIARRSKCAAMDPPVVIRSAGRPASREIDPKVMRCRSARAHREAVLQAAGLKRTYDLLSQLDREVWEACKDVPGA